MQRISLLRPHSRIQIWPPLHPPSLRTAGCHCNTVVTTVHLRTNKVERKVYHNIWINLFTERTVQVRYAGHEKKPFFRLRPKRAAMAPQHCSSTQDRNMTVDKEKILVLLVHLSSCLSWVVLVCPPPPCPPSPPGRTPSHYIKKIGLDL